MRLARIEAKERRQVELKPRPAGCCPRHAPGIVLVISRVEQDCQMKQVIVVNRSLALPKGKLAAQVAHAAVGAFVAATAQAQAAWLEIGMPKIVIYAADADALIQLEARAREQQLPPVWFTTRDAPLFRQARLHAWDLDRRPPSS